MYPNVLNILYLYNMLNIFTQNQLKSSTELSIDERGNFGQTTSTINKQGVNVGDPVHEGIMTTYKGGRRINYIDANTNKKYDEGEDVTAGINQQIGKLLWQEKTAKDRLNYQISKQNKQYDDQLEKESKRAYEKLKRGTVTSITDSNTGETINAKVSLQKKADLHKIASLTFR